MNPSPQVWKDAAKADEFVGASKDKLKVRASTGWRGLGAAARLDCRPARHARRLQAATPAN
jgi:hypothetical protein